MFDSSPFNSKRNNGLVRSLARIPMMKTVHIVCGPTAGGKSAYALNLAQRNNGLIINVDSRQIYEGLPILTAQPNAADLAAAPHALYGVLHPNTPCSAGFWLNLSKPVIEQAFDKNQTPIITGGTGLYIKALLEGLSPIPPVSEDVRAQAVLMQQSMGNPAFHDMLKKHDPLSAERYHPMHTARLVHAWEVLQATGKTLSYWQSLPKQPISKNWNYHVTMIMPPRDLLYQRCDARFDIMMEQGAEDELEKFDARVKNNEVSPNAILIKTVGAEPLRAYRAGVFSKDEAIIRAKAETRHYAKRQVTWFKHQIKPMDCIAGIEILE
jgi:tRNA dimethylallyltransferase